METASVKELKEELKTRGHKELVDLCIRLSVFKKENKELLTYLLFESDDEENFVSSVKKQVSKEFRAVNRSSNYYIKKSIRKILSTIKKYIRYSKKKETEIELLLHFCTELKKFRPGIDQNYTIHNIFIKQIALIRKAVSTLHEDLQYDYNEEINKIF